MPVEPDLSELPVEALVEGLSQAGPGASSLFVEEIIRRFEPLLRTSFRPHRGVEYRDFVQEVFLRLFQGLPKLRNPKAFPGYLLMVCRSVAIDLRRRERGPEESPVENDIVFEDTDEPLMARILVRSMLERLPPRERQVVRSLLLEGVTAQTLAANLGIEEGAVRTTLSRALGRLRELFLAEASQLESRVAEKA